ENLYCHLLVFFFYQLNALPILPLLLINERETKPAQVDSADNDKKFNVSSLINLTTTRKGLS
ncbi:MAG: hypothetical protein Q8877_02665, partial [Sweet potato little leaf phytoplasma]|nr:hypothetical protein [Sweet potato little leaf phytoplasma]